MSKKTDPAKAAEPVVPVPAPGPVLPVEPPEPAAAPEPPEASADKRSCIFTVNTRRGLNLRPAPSREAAPLTVLPYQAVVIATGETVSAGEDEWLPVRTIDGAKGFVMWEYLNAINIDEEDL